MNDLSESLKLDAKYTKADFCLTRLAIRNSKHFMQTNFSTETVETTSGLMVPRASWFLNKLQARLFPAQVNSGQV